MNIPSSTLSREDVPIGGAVWPHEGRVVAAPLTPLWGWPLCLTVGFAASAWLALQIPLNHDVAWALTMAARLLDGSGLGVGPIDSNPPLIYLLSLPVVALARLTGWPESVAVTLTVLALVALALRLVHLAVRAGALRAGHERTDWLVGVTLVSVTLTLLVTPGRELGEREHLMMILLLPYAVWCVAAANGARSAGGNGHAGDLSPLVRGAIGACAAVGLAIKPHFLLAALTLFAYVAVSRRSLRALRAVEHLMIPVGAGLYVIGLLIFAPAYARDIIPFALTQYPAYTATVDVLLRDWLFWLVTLSTVTLALCGPWITGDRQWGSLVRVFALMGLASLAVYFIQLRGFSEQFLPARAFNFLAMLLAIAGFVRDRVLHVGDPEAIRPGPRAALKLATRTALMALAAVPAAFIVSLVVNSYTVDIDNAREGIRSPLAEPLIDIVHTHAAGRPIFVLASSVFPAFPLVNLSGATWPYRHNSLSWLPAYYRAEERYEAAAYRAPAAQSPAERARFDEVVREMVERPPVVLVVDIHRFKQGFGSIHFDFLKYYGQSPAFAELMRHYRLLEQRSGFLIFEYTSEARS